MKRISLLLLPSVAIPLLVFGQSPSNGIKRPFDPRSAPLTTGDHGVEIFYHGGPVMIANKHIYTLYYGEFKSSTTDIIDTFLENVGGSGAFGVNTTYFNSRNQHVQNALAYNPAIDSFDDHYSMGHSLHGAFDVQLLSFALSGGFFPTDPNGIYVLVTSPDVTVPPSTFCGYHANSSTIAPGFDIKYAVAPDPNSKNFPGCSGNFAVYHEANSPNDDPGADSVCDTLIHELSEATTDPDGTAWFGNLGAENADLCNFFYGATFLAPNGTHADQIFAGRDYLVQTIWQNTGNGFCANSLSR